MLARSHGKDRGLANRLEVLRERATVLEDALKTALVQRTDPAQLIAEMNDFRDQIADIEAAIDLDFKAGSKEVKKELKSLQDNPSEHNKYTDGGGVSDGVDVDNEYSPGKACSLFSLLAVVPDFMGARDAPHLHEILRRTETLQEYDEDVIAAKIRFAAGLEPTMQGRSLGAILDEIMEGSDRPSFIADPAGEAHVFAAVWDGEKYHPKDNGETSSATNLLDKRKGKSVRDRQVASTWKK